MPSSTNLHNTSEATQPLLKNRKKLLKSLPGPWLLTATIPTTIAFRISTSQMKRTWSQTNHTWTSEATQCRRRSTWRRVNCWWIWLGKTSVFGTRTETCLSTAWNWTSLSIFWVIWVPSKISRPSLPTFLTSMRHWTRPSSPNWNLNLTSHSWKAVA